MTPFNIKTLSITTIFLLFYHCIFAQVNWTGGNGDWNIASNWDSNSVLTADDQVIISGNSAVATINSSVNALARAILKTSNASLTNEGGLVINAQDMSNCIQNEATIINEGTILISDSGGGIQ